MKLDIAGWLIRHAYSGFELRSALESDLMQSNNVYPVFFDNNIDSEIWKQKFMISKKLVKHEQLIVREMMDLKISKDQLLVTHESAEPSEIQFTIQTPPIFGSLLNENNQPIRTFTQADIIHQNIRYSNTLNSLVDVFELNVTNHYTHIENIKIGVEIIPKTLPLRSTDVTVDEGESVALGDALKVLGHVTHNFTIRILEKCSHGKLRMLGAKKDTKKFPFSEKENVLYIHDGSENHQG